jgi:hypothetical protein
MANHCLCCRGQYVGEVRGTGTPSSMGASMLMDCPGVTCPECADAAEWHRAIMAETCGEDEKHCVCVPVLRRACADKDKQIIAQRETMETLERIQEEEIAEHVRLSVSEACADRDEQLYRLGDELAEVHLEIARLTTALEAAERENRRLCVLHQLERSTLKNQFTDLQSATRKVVEAIDNCLGGRGAFSCAPKHDCRCTKDRGINDECVCGADDLDAALADPVLVALGRE